MIKRETYIYKITNLINGKENIYNISDGGEGAHNSPWNKGKYLSEDTKQKLRLSREEANRD